VANAGGKVFTFGSFRLGIHSPDADIDALCVAPRHVDRSDFFKGFVTVLEKTPGVTDIRVVEEAYVPVLKMKFDDIEVDLLFAKLLVSQIKDDQVTCSSSFHTTADRIMDCGHEDDRFHSFARLIFLAMQFPLS
jgi:poly(A) polymerase Pap1